MSAGAKLFRRAALSPKVSQRTVISNRCIGTAEGASPSRSRKSAHQLVVCDRAVSFQRGKRAGRSAHGNRVCAAGVRRMIPDNTLMERTLYSFTSCHPLGRIIVSNVSTHNWGTFRPVVVSHRKARFSNARGASSDVPLQDRCARPCPRLSDMRVVGSH
jgi:hypothetical protein